MNQSFDALRGGTSNAKIAATAIALDVPLHKTSPWVIAAGDGIQGTRVVWQFQGTSPDGNTIAAVANAWQDSKWIATNPVHEVTRIKLAFDALARLSATAKGDARHYDLILARDTISNASSAMAATLIALGHPCRGYTRGNNCLFWHFDRAAASDMALWEDHDLHLKLPSTMISYIKCALLNWKTLLNECVAPQIMAVKHGSRTAYVGTKADQNIQNTIEKLLFRK